jgi:hypothetical protein
MAKKGEEIERISNMEYKQALCGTREAAMDRYFIGSLDK